MTKECPCSPREATLGASPRWRAAAGRANLSIIPRRTASRARRRYVREPPKKNCRCSFRGSSASRTSRPRRGTSRTCGPLSKRAPIAGVLRPLSQVTFCERAANETHILCVSAFPRSSSFAAGFGKKTNAKKRREKNRQKPTSRAPRLSHPVLVTVFFSRKMVNILNVDRHRQSVAWIKLCIIENVVRVFRAFGSGGRGRMGTPRAAVIVLRGAFGLSDELGYASGDGRHRITVDFARHSRHGKYNLQSRAVRVSSARESVHTRASAGMMKKKISRRNRRRHAAPHAPRSRQMVCSIGVMAAREVCPITTPAPRGTSVAKRKRSPHRLRASRGAGRARRARERGRVRGKKRRLRSELYLTNNGRAASGASLETRGESCRTISE